MKIIPLIENIEEFDLNYYLLTTCLNDAAEDGGLFGIRFE